MRGVRPPLQSLYMGSPTHSTQRGRIVMRAASEIVVIVVVVVNRIILLRNSFGRSWFIPLPEAAIAGRLKTKQQYTNAQTDRTVGN